MAFQTSEYLFILAHPIRTFNSRCFIVCGRDAGNKLFTRIERVNQPEILDRRPSDQKPLILKVGVHFGLPYGFEGSPSSTVSIGYRLSTQGTLLLPSHQASLSASY